MKLVGKMRRSELCVCVLEEANSRLGFVEGEASCFAGGEEGVRIESVSCFWLK